VIRGKIVGGYLRECWGKRVDTSYRSYKDTGKNCAVKGCKNTIYYCDDKTVGDEICGTCDMYGGRREMYTYVFYYICILTKFLLIM